MSLCNCVSQTIVMLDSLVIFPLFQSGSTPNDGRALQSSTDLRIRVDGNLVDAGGGSGGLPRPMTSSHASFS